MATFYLSSTFEDLKECREAVSKTLRQMGHQVEGMENYTADGRAPLKKCLDDVAKCHAYIGIFAWRYGYVPTENNRKRKAITELEYRRARELKREALIFILDEDASWPGSRYAKDEKERERIKKLREALARIHTVSFFKDCSELAALVSVVVSKRFPSTEDEPLPPPPPPPPRTPLPWKWYAVAAVVAAVLGAVLFYQIKPRYWPDEYPTEKKYDFPLSERERLNRIWRLPPGAWALEKGEGKGANDGALLIKGGQMAMPNDLGPKVFYDYRADFKVRFKAGDKVAWVLRAQRDGRSGYLFELRKQDATLFLTGWVFKDNRLGDPLPPVEKILQFSTCCKPADSLRIIAEVTNEADGTHIKHHFDFDSDDDNSEEAGEGDDATFVDREAVFKWGTIGLLVTDGITTPETTGGEMRVEYVNLTPLRAKAEGAGPSPERNAP